uniref:Uncharacterized protein n=1 Tax=Hordeum vulgare subsp. vulgare TaxID=112509 RepID=M0XVB6_HORVV
MYMYGTPKSMCLRWVSHDSVRIRSGVVFDESTGFQSSFVYVSVSFRSDTSDLCLSSLTMVADSGAREG